MKILIDGESRGRYFQRLEREKLLNPTERNHPAKGWSNKKAYVVSGWEKRELAQPNYFEDEKEETFNLCSQP